MRVRRAEDDRDPGPGTVYARAALRGRSLDRRIDAAHLGETEHYDAAALDLGLPGRDGVTVLGHWRVAKRDLPALILTARECRSDKVSKLKAGAHDYLLKPLEA